MCSHMASTSSSGPATELINLFSLSVLLCFLGIQLATPTRRPSPGLRQAPPALLGPDTLASCNLWGASNDHAPWKRPVWARVTMWCRHGCFGLRKGGRILRPRLGYHTSAPAPGLCSSIPGPLLPDSAVSWYLLLRQTTPIAICHYARYAPTPTRCLLARAT